MEQWGIKMKLSTNDMKDLMEVDNDENVQQPDENDGPILPIKI